MTNKNIVLEEQPEPLKEIERFEWRGTVEDITYLHTKVLWKGHHVLSILKHVDMKVKKPSTRAFDDDEDEDEDETTTGTEGVEVYPVSYWVQSEWKWLKTGYGEPKSYDEAREVAISSVTDIFTNIRKAFMLKGTP